MFLTMRHTRTLNLELRSMYAFYNSQRFKGHSHWQNIRHTKQTNDQKRSSQISMYMRKLQGIVNLKNGDANPETNTALASVLEQAKKENVPVATLQRFLKKITERDVTPHQVYFKGPDNYVIAITYDKKRQQFFRQAVKKACRDYKVSMQEISNVDDIFVTKGVIVSKAPSTNTTLEIAEEDAIIAGAEEVQEVESADKEEKVFQFITLHEDLWSVVKELKGKGWTMYDHKHELIPVCCVELSDEKMAHLHDLVSALEEIPEVDKVVVNIA